MDYVGVRKNHDETAPGSGQQMREGNQWIKPWSSFDLEGMEVSPTRQLAGAQKAPAGLGARHDQA
jgi:hypothetical protein